MGAAPFAPRCSIVVGHIVAVFISVGIVAGVEPGAIVPALFDDAIAVMVCVGK